MSSNTAQRENWEQGAGAKWVKLADTMEQRLTPVNDIVLAHARPRPGERVLDVGCGGVPRRPCWPRPCNPAGQWWESIYRRRCWRLRGPRRFQA